MKIILDNTKEITIHNFNENYDEFGTRLHCVYITAVQENTIFPTVGNVEDYVFTDIKVINNQGIEIPLQYTYSTVDNINIGYDDVSNNYIITYNIK